MIDLAAVIKSCRGVMRKDKGLSGELDRLPMLTWILFLKFLDDFDRVRETEAALGDSIFIPTVEPPYRWRDWAAPSDGLTGDDLLSFINSDEALRPDESKGPGLFAYLRALQGREGGDRRDVVARVFHGVTNRMINGYLLRELVNKATQIHFDSSEQIETLGHIYETMLRELRDAAGDSGEFYTPRPVVRFMIETLDLRLGEQILDPACGTGGFLVAAHRVLAQKCKTVEDHEVLERSLKGGEAKPLPYLLVEMNLLLHGIEAPDIDPGNSLRFKIRELGERDRVDVIATNPPFGGEEERGILGNFPPDRQTTETAALFLQLIMRRLRSNGTAGRPGRCAMVVNDGFLSTRGVQSRIKEDLLENFNLHTVVRLPRGVFAPYTPIKTNLLFFEAGTPTKRVWYYEVPPPVGRQMYTKTKPLPYEELSPILEDWWQCREESERAWSVSVEELHARDYDLDIPNPRRPIDESCAEPVELLSLANSSINGVGDALGGLAKLFDELPTRGDAPVVPVGKALRLRKEFISLDDDVVYRLVTVQLHARGLKSRGSKGGSEIKMKKQQLLQRNDLVVAEIDAKVGGFGLVPADLAGSIVSSHYFVYEVDGDVLDVEFLHLYLQSGLPEVAIQPYVKGSTNYASVRQHHFPMLEIPLPTVAWQQRFAQQLTRLARAADDALGKVDTLHIGLHSLVPAILNRCFDAGNQEP